MNTGNLQMAAAIRPFPARAPHSPRPLSVLQGQRTGAAAFAAVLKFASVQIAAGLGCLLLLPMLGALILASAWRRNLATEAH